MISARDLLIPALEIDIKMCECSKKHTTGHLSIYEGTQSPALFQLLPGTRLWAAAREGRHKGRRIRRRCFALFCIYKNLHGNEMRINVNREPKDTVNANGRLPYSRKPNCL